MHTHMHCQRSTHNVCVCVCVCVCVFLFSAECPHSTNDKLFFCFSFFRCFASTYVRVGLGFGV